MYGAWSKGKGSYAIQGIARHDEDAPDVARLPDEAEMMKKNHQEVMAMVAKWQA